MNLLHIDGNTILTEVACSEEEHARGLMHCAWPPPVMTFVFSSPRVSKFWMKNTPSPLDIIFCLGGKVRHISHGIPNSEKLIGEDVPSDLVIEMPRGMAEHLNIKAGCSVEIDYDAGTLANKLSAKYF